MLHKLVSYITKMMGYPLTNKQETDMCKTILYIDSTYSYGGAPLCLQSLLETLDRKKYRPIVITNIFSTYNHILENKIQDVTYIPLKLYNPMTHSSIFRFFKKVIGSKLSTVGRVLFWTTIGMTHDLFRYLLICKKYHVDLIHTNNGFCMNLAPALTAKILNIPYVPHHRGLLLFGEPYGDFLRIAPKMSSHSIAISDMVKKSLLDLGTPDSKITKIWDGSDIFIDQVESADLKRQFNIPSNNKLYGIAGRILPWKGVDHFINAAAIVYKKIPNSNALIIGAVESPDEKEYLEEIQKQIKTLGLERHIIFTGFRRDIFSVIKSLDVMVNASIEPEPLGRTLWEAMALDVPSISYNHGGPVEIIENNKSGFLIPVGDSEEMGNKISEILLNPQISQKFKHEGRKRYHENFTSMKCTSKIEDLYEKLLSS